MGKGMGKTKKRINEDHENYNGNTNNKKLRYDDEPRTPENSKTDTYTCPPTVTVAEFLANYVESPENTPIKTRPEKKQTPLVAAKKGESETSQEATKDEEDYACDVTEEAEKDEDDYARELTEEFLKEAEVRPQGDSIALTLDFDYIQN